MPCFSLAEGVGFRSTDCSCLMAGTGVADALRVSCGDSDSGG